MKGSILTINGGSSSLKFALFEEGGALGLIFRGVMEPKKSGGYTMTLFKTDQSSPDEVQLQEQPGAAVENSFIDWLETQPLFSTIKAVGHRVVHGMNHTHPEQITPGLIAELKGIISFDPEHLEGEVRMIEAFSTRFPAWISVACFDTAFHADMPELVKMLPIPRHYFPEGIRRYGFHGLSYSYLMHQLENIAGKQTANGRIILAHLGSGSSLAAVRNGHCLDTSMGFTPASGIVMSTRTGDIDPGVMYYLINHEKLTAEQINDFVNNKSGLLGISETSGSVRELLKTELTDSRAAQAVALFCYQVKKWIGSYSAVLGGLDTLIFSGGIGEHTPEVRERACADLTYLGLEIDPERNKKNEAIISSDTSRVTVRVIPTIEELMIARLTAHYLTTLFSK